MLTDQKEREVKPDQQFLICMGFDAMRIAIGKKPKNYSIREVTTWIQCISKELRKVAPVKDSHL